MSRSYGAESRDSSSHSRATPRVDAGETGTQDLVLAVDLRRLVEDLEEIPWHRVDGVSSSTAMAFTARVESAEESLRR